MSGAELAKLQALIDGGNVDAFYHWAAWERLRDEVLRLDNFECQLCKARGKHRRAVVVHHVQHVKDGRIWHCRCGTRRRGSGS